MESPWGRSILGLRAPMKHADAWVKSADWAKNLASVGDPAEADDLGLSRPRLRGRCLIAGHDIGTAVRASGGPVVARAELTVEGRIEAEELQAPLAPECGVAGCRAPTLEIAPWPSFNPDGI